MTNTPPDSETAATWLITEELRIGTVDGEGPASFGELKGLAVARDGRIAVLDAQVQELRVFSGQGQHLATYGGRGGGPGEMEGAFGLMLAPNGPLWVPDYRNARMSVCDLDNGFVDAHELSVLSRAYVWRGIMTAEGRVLKPSITLDSPTRDVLRVYSEDMTLADVLPLPGSLSDDRTAAPCCFYFEAPGVRGISEYPSFLQDRRS